MNRVGVVTGMAAEARCLRQPGACRVVAVLCSGGDAGRAGDCARRLLAGGADRLLSFGLAGGLDPALRSGAVVVAENVIGPGGERWQTDRLWREAVLAVPGSGQRVVGDVAGSDRPVVSVAERAELFARVRACAVDMESHAVARVAAENGAAFSVLRVIADPAGRTLPRAALVGLRADGRTRPLAVLGRLALRPWELPAVLALAFDVMTALRVLRREAATSLFSSGLV